jgi:putative heme-binding domain-containing protein
MRNLLLRTSGNAKVGADLFQRVCGQCHRIHGSGQDVGPDITSNGRSSYDQLLSNVFDPSLVIGPAYQAVQVATADGRVLVGLIAENNEQRVVLKVQGGKTETIPRSEIDEFAPSKLSLMPEGLEQQLTPQEIADLFAFLTLDRPPHDPMARPIAGTPMLSDPPGR